MNRNEIEATLHQELHGLTDFADIDLAEQAGNLVQGRFWAIRTPVSRKGKIAVWVRTNEGLKPAAVFACLAVGFASKTESAILKGKRQTIVLRRIGAAGTWYSNEEEIGSIQYSWELRHLFFGKALLHVRSSSLCEMILPLVGPSLYQRNDCVGKFRFPDKSEIKFVIKPKDRPVPLRETVGVVHSSFSSVIKEGLKLHVDLFSTSPQPETSSLFPTEYSDMLNSLSPAQRVLLAANAVWCRSLYKYA